MSLLTGKSFGPKFMDEVEYKQAYEYISNNFYWISPLDDMTLENILLKARYLVRRYGIKSLILDPYNKFDHSRDRGETETEYISRFLDRLTYFAQKNDLLIFLIAHPTKMQRDTKDQLKYMVPTLYDIAGSANFYNKADYGLVVHRDFETGKTLINVAKVRFRNWGDGGSQEFYFCKVNNRYDASTMFDFQSYIENKKTQLFISKNETNEFSPNL